MTGQPDVVPFLRFDFPAATGQPRPLCFERPVRVITAHDVSEVRAAMRAVEQGRREGYYAAGYVAYEAAPAFDEALTTKARCDVPLVWFGLFREPVEESAVAAAADASTPEAASTPTGVGREAAARTTGADAATTSARGSVRASVPASAWRADISREAYARGIDAVKAAIARGDTYQVNYTFRLRAHVGREHGAREPQPGPEPEPERGGVSTGSASRADGQDGLASPETHPDVETQPDALALYGLYRRLSDAQRVPYAAYLHLGEWQVLSLSPELFFSTRGRRLMTRPMKGTAARGRWTDEDRAQRAWLASSEKNRAENVMIVDLARNDVGRIAEVGSVRATALFEVERYPTVFQMVSTVEGVLREETTLEEIFAALFPAGSITGAPKSSSMRLIAEVEDAPRGVYCGAIGFVTPAGDATFSVGIRTAVVHSDTGRAEYGVGGGITWDSTADAEHAEALSKAAALSLPPAFELLETMRLEDGVYARREHHLRRLEDSARYWASCGLFGEGGRSGHPGATATDPRRDDEVANDGDRPARREERALAMSLAVSLAMSRDAVEAALDDEARRHPSGAWRVRLRVSRDGTMRIESTLLTPLHEGPSLPRVVLARTPVSSRDRFLFHKTTWRATYDAHRAAHPDTFDVLLWNEAREITEFTFGNVVVEIEGARVTPPRASGLLAGTLRGELLDAGGIEERVLMLDDLASVSRMWLINSVRGWIEVTPPAV